MTESKNTKGHGLRVRFRGRWGRVAGRGGRQRGRHSAQCTAWSWFIPPEAVGAGIQGRKAPEVIPHGAKNSPHGGSSDAERMSLFPGYSHVTKTTTHTARNGVGVGAVGDPGLADACSSPVTGGAPLTRDSAPRGEWRTPPSREAALRTPSQGPIRVPDPGAFSQPPSGTAGWSARVAKQAGRGVGGGPAGATGRASCPEGWAARSRGAASGAPGSLDGGPSTHTGAGCLSGKELEGPEGRAKERVQIPNKAQTCHSPLSPQGLQLLVPRPPGGLRGRQPTSLGPSARPGASALRRCVWFPVRFHRGQTGGSPSPQSELVPGVRSDEVLPEGPSSKTPPGEMRASRNERGHGQGDWR